MRLKQLSRESGNRDKEVIRSFQKGTVGCIIGSIVIKKYSRKKTEDVIGDNDFKPETILQEHRELTGKRQHVDQSYAERIKERGKKN